MRYDIQTLRTFLAVAEEGSIARAATRENTVASAVSKRISDMEKISGVSLVSRHRRGVYLTSAGAELVLHARRIFDEIGRLDGALSNYAAGVKGEVRLLANTSAITQFLPSDIASFLRGHPTVKIDLEERPSEQTQKLLLDGLADVGVLVRTIPVLAGLYARHYHSDRLSVMLPIGHPLAKKKSIKFKDTLAYDHVGLPRGTSLCEQLLAMAQEAKVPLKLRIQGTSFDGLRKMVSSGVGIGILPHGSILPFVEADRLEARPLAEPWATRQLLVVTREHSTLPRAARLLADHLVQVASAGKATISI